MRFELFAQRLAERCDTPELAPVLLGEASPETLPTSCMIWTGARRGGLEKPRIRSLRRTPTMVRDHPYGVVRWKGKEVRVHRLIFQLITRPDYEYRLSSRCGVALCVNPLHWEVHRIDQRVGGASFQEPDFDEDWTLKDVEQLLEIAFTHHDLRTREDVLNCPTLLDVPRDLLDEGLKLIRKDHML